MTIEVYQDALGEWRWRLQAANGEIVAGSGEGYTRKSDALRAAKLLKRETWQARIEVIS